MLSSVERVELNCWLAGLEKAKTFQEAYLWPHTPVANLQAEIMKRQGVTDYAVASTHCRSTIIANTLERLVTNDLIRREFSLIDLCCGDGAALAMVALKHWRANLYGVDLTHYGDHDWLSERTAARYYHASLQAVIASEPPCRLDVVVMLNTFRSWAAAELPRAQMNLPHEFLTWVRRHARYLIATGDRDTIEGLISVGWFVFDIGPGEDGSVMFIAFACEEEGGTLWKPKAG